MMDAIYIGNGKWNLNASKARIKDGWTDPKCNVIWMKLRWTLDKA